MDRPVNTPKLWVELLPVPSPRGNKYDRGHVLILGAPELTGATRLAATACMRIGAGLVTVVAGDATLLYRTVLPPEIMVWQNEVEVPRRPDIILAGCGGGDPSVLPPLLSKFSDCPWVLDAGFIAAALSCGMREHQKTVITPHQGEFDRTFPRMTGPRQERACKVAKLTGFIVVLKGPQTIIASPDNRVKLNVHASPYLASAGTGDVLAGLITGLIAQGMPAYEACCAAVWMHGAAAIRLGPGLVACDIVNLLPRILGELLEPHAGI